MSHGFGYGRNYFIANFQFWKQKTFSLNMSVVGKIKNGYAVQEFIRLRRSGGLRGINRVKRSEKGAGSIVKDLECLRSFDSTWCRNL